MMLWWIAALAVLMIVLGRWGQRRAGELVSPVLSPSERVKTERGYRRGAITLQVVGVAFLCFAAVGLVVGTAGP